MKTPRAEPPRSIQLSGLERSELAAEEEITVLAWPGYRYAQFNRYTASLYDHLRPLGVHVIEFSSRAMLKGSFDLLHVHWPEWTISRMPTLRALGKVGRLAIAMSYLKVRRKKIVWTVHNDEPHSRHSALAASLLYWTLSRLVDLQIHLTDGTRETLERRRHPARCGRFTVIPHGLLDEESDYPPKQLAREELGLSARAEVLAFIGGIDGYKGVDNLIEAFKRLGGDGRRLIIAGKPSSSELEGALRLAAASDPRISLSFGFLSDGEVRAAVAAADLVVLPYRSVLNSGSAFTVLAGHRPVLLPSTPTFQSMRRQFGEWVELFDGPLKTGHLESALRSSIRTTRPDFSSVAWEQIARRTRDAYAAVSGAPPRGRSGDLQGIPGSGGSGV